MKGATAAAVVNATIARKARSKLAEVPADARIHPVFAQLPGLEQVPGRQLPLGQVL